VLKFANFRCYDNGGDLSKVWLTFFNWPPLNTHNGCKYLGYISYASWVITSFVLKFANYCYPGNRWGLSKVWLTWINWPKLKTSNRWKHLGCIPCAAWVIANFVLKFRNFRCCGNSVSVSSLNDAQALKVHGHGQTHSRYLLRFQLGVSPRVYNTAI